MNCAPSPRPVRSGRIPRPTRISSPSRTKLKKPISSPSSSTTARSPSRRAGFAKSSIAARIGSGVVPLVRELVPPLGDLPRVLLGQRIDPHGSEPTRATQRAAASSPRRAASSSEPPSRNPAASASPAPVESTTSASTGARSSRASSVTTVMPRAPRLIRPGRRGQVGAAEHLPLGLGREEHVGRDRVEQLAELHRAVRADLRPGGDVDGDARTAAAREPRGEQRRVRDRLAQAARSPRGAARRIRPRRRRAPRARATARRRGRRPSSGRRRRRRARRRRRSRPPPTGPASSTPSAASSRATSSPAASSPRFAMQRASAPSEAAQAATFAAWPPAPVRVCARTSSPCASGCSSRTITSSITSPSVASFMHTIVPRSRLQAPTRATIERPRAARVPRSLPLPPRLARPSPRRRRSGGSGRRTRSRRSRTSPSRARARRSRPRASARRAARGSRRRRPRSRPRGRRAPRAPVDRASGRGAAPPSRRRRRRSPSDRSGTTARASQRRD